jgi:hypothetical protein
VFWPQKPTVLEPMKQKQSPVQDGMAPQDAPLQVGFEHAPFTQMPDEHLGFDQDDFILVYKLS